MINFPARDFGPKALNVLESEAAWRLVSLMVALETASPPPRSRSAGLRFADVVRAVGRDQQATLADQISLLLDGTGYRNMLLDSRTETTEGRLENIQELMLLEGGFHTARELLNHAALATNGPGEDEAGRVRLMTLHKGKGARVSSRVSSGLGIEFFSAAVWRTRGRAALGICRAHPGDVAGDDFALRLPTRLRGPIAIHW